MMSAWIQTLARSGMKVFPVHGIIEPGATENEARCSCGRSPCKSPGKHPTLMGWQDAATTDPNVIGRWFADSLSPRNYGVALDGETWTVVEVDPYDGGRLRALRELAGELGPISMSGRGFHVWFRATILPNGTKLGQG